MNIEFIKDFAFLLHRMGDLSENEQHRGAVKEPLLYEKNIIEVPMVQGARLFIPFDKIKGKIKILYLAATPMSQKQLNTGKESRLFKDIIARLDKKRRFLVEDEHGISPERFKEFLIYEDAHIVHYGGHGEKEGILLEGERLDADRLVKILQASEKTQCVILNACNSLAIAQAVAQHIPYVIATQSAISDSTAMAFINDFYLGIVSGRTIEKAFEIGISELKNDAHVLVLVKGVPKPLH